MLVDMIVEERKGGRNQERVLVWNFRFQPSEISILLAFLTKDGAEEDHDFRTCAEICYDGCYGSNQHCGEIVSQSHSFRKVVNRELVFARLDLDIVRVLQPHISIQSVKFLLLLFWLERMWLIEFGGGGLTA